MKPENGTEGHPQVGSDAGLGFERAKTHALQKAFDEYNIGADRILAGTWDESELSPDMREYVNRRRHFHTPEWIKPNAELSRPPTNH